MTNFASKLRDLAGRATAGRKAPAMSEAKRPALAVDPERFAAKYEAVDG